MLLAGDIGGTKTALGVFSEERGAHAALAESEVHSADHGSLESIAKEFLAKTGLKVDRACFGVAGPVLAGRAKVTNLPWIVDQAAMAKELSLDAVHLLNDLEAIACAIPGLRPEDVEELSAGAPVEHGNIAVFAPGTGLGEAFLTWEETEYRAHSSEGGHADFAPTDEVQIRLLEFMQQRFEHVSYEHVCSGVGIPHVYDFFRDCEKTEERAEIAERIAMAGDRTKAIIRSALDAVDPSPRCTATIETVVSIMGSEAGNLALKVLAVGGVYLAGGVAVHLLPALKSPRFLRSFRHKGRFAEVMSRIPVHLMTGKVGLAGAAAYGLRRALAATAGTPIPRAS
ncbi:MAG: glucokinase [Terriglobia bacterium]|nr:MAG: glucokinase [Terriglobia bacterium]